MPEDFASSVDVDENIAKREAFLNNETARFMSALLEIVNKKTIERIENNLRFKAKEMDDASSTASNDEILH